MMFCIQQVSLPGDKQVSIPVGLSVKHGGCRCLQATCLSIQGCELIYLSNYDFQEV